MRACRRKHWVLFVSILLSAPSPPPRSILLQSTTPSSAAARTGGALYFVVPVLVSISLQRARTLPTMDASDNQVNTERMLDQRAYVLTPQQAFRTSKMSRLPAPSTQIGGGLTEWSDSQHNARIQTSMPAPTISWKGLKREIPQPGKYLPSACICSDRGRSLLTNAQHHNQKRSANLFPNEHSNIQQSRHRWLLLHRLRDPMSEDRTLLASLG